MKVHIYHHVTHATFQCIEIDLFHICNAAEILKMVLLLCAPISIRLFHFYEVQQTEWIPRIAWDSVRNEYAYE